MSILPKLAIIGFGKRVRGTIIPALASQKNKVRLCSIYTRREVSIEDLRETQQILNFNNRKLTEFQPNNYDYLYLGIPPTQLYPVLKNIVKNHSDLKTVSLILDTPFPIGKNPLTIIKIARLLRNFKSHIILEDCIFLEPYAHAPTISQFMKLGDPQFSHFINSGFRYHAYSQIKSFHNIKNFHLVIRPKTKSLHGQQLIFNKFKHIATITEPRNYSYGRFSFWYDFGVYSDYIKEEETKRCVNLLISPSFIDNKLNGFSIKCLDDDIYKINFQLPIVVGGGDLGQSIFNISKINAVACFIDALISKETKMYRTVDCVYDSIVDIFVNRFGIFFDIPIPFKRSTILYIVLERIFK